MTSNPIRVHICGHCGTAGNGYITYDSGFDFNCYSCSNVEPLKPNEITPEFRRQKYLYAEHVLKTRKVITKEE